MTPLRIFTFCEARQDFEIARDLIDRVLREGPDWVSSVLETSPEAIRCHEGRGGSSFVDLHRQSQYALELGVRVPHGHFDGRPGAAGAIMARTSFAIARKQSADAVVLIWDMDQQVAERRLGLEQAVREARKLQRFLIVIGAPNIMREAWVLAGFIPRDDELEVLQDLRQELGFSPIENAHLLDANNEMAKRSPKRVLRRLSLGVAEREEECWRDTPLGMLRDRSAETGLAEFLDEARQLLRRITD